MVVLQVVILSLLEEMVSFNRGLKTSLFCIYYICLYITFFYFLTETLVVIRKCVCVRMLPEFVIKSRRRCIIAFSFMYVLRCLILFFWSVVYSSSLSSTPTSLLRTKGCFIWSVNSLDFGVSCIAVYRIVYSVTKRSIRNPSAI